MSAEYELALNAVREATRKMDAVRKSYRAGNLSDSDYLAALAEYKEADKAYEAAYVKAQRMKTV